MDDDAPSEAPSRQSANSGSKTKASRKIAVQGWTSHLKFLKDTGASSEDLSLAQAKLEEAKATPTVAPTHTQVENELLRAAMIIRVAYAAFETLPKKTLQDIHKYFAAQLEMIEQARANSFVIFGQVSKDQQLLVEKNTQEKKDADADLEDVKSKATPAQNFLS